MLPSRRWSADGAWLLVAAVGIAAEWHRPAGWVPDLLTGWTLAGCGLVACRRRPESRSGLLLAGAGLLWFVPSFTGGALFLHRGPLAHCVLTYPSGRAAGRAQLAAIGAFYVAAAVAPVWQNGIATIVLAAALVAVVLREYARAVGPRRRLRLAALQATAFLATVLAATSIVRLATSEHAAAAATLHAYEAALCLLSVGLLVGLLGAPWHRAEVTDLVVELGEARGGTLRDALARALGDPSLEVGYRVPGGYVDAEGRPVRLPAEGSARAVTRVDTAVLVHDPAVLDDAGLVEAVASATRLAAVNARLRADLQARLAELTASRQRIVEAADEERARLAGRLREGAQRQLGELEGALADARRSAASARTAEGVARSQARLARTQEALRQLAQGIHPRELRELGLADALAAATADFPLQVELSVSGLDLPPAVSACAYFLCLEGLSNATKYAAASKVAISLWSAPSGVAVEVADDGVGGADFARGTGLRGLADRVEALGGSLHVESPPGGGTRLSALIPGT